MNTLKIGDKVPNFSVTDQDGNTITMQDYQDKKVIVFFYPAASTPGCTAEACNLRDHYKDLQLLVLAQIQKRSNLILETNMNFHFLYSPTQIEL